MPSLGSLFTRDEEFLSAPGLYLRRGACKGSQEAEIFRLYEVDSDADTLLIVRPSSEVTKNSALELNGHKDDGLTNGLSKPHINGQNFSTELRIKNSSMHLSLASRHLSNKIRHNAAVQSGGRIHIPLEDVKPAAAIVPSLLKRVSGIAVPQSTEVVGTYGLPIRQKIITLFKPLSTVLVYCGPPNSTIDGAGFGALIEASRENEKMHENWQSNIGSVFVKPLYSSKPSKPETHSDQPQAIVIRQPQKVEREAGGLELESSLGYAMY
ncbi:hypothetical protein M0657_005085 [Pyricularia oryzae]|nr:hypothetical protein M0657_005085 [Pyricularia oryzae]